MTTQNLDVVEQQVRIAARPETVFPFFTDPEKMTMWKGTWANLDPRPGGMYRVNVTGTAIARGEYLEVSPVTRVVFTWGWEGKDSAVPPGSSTVEVTLTPDGDGTVVRLLHRGLSAEAAAEHRQGWTHYLGRLTETSEGL